MKYSLKVNAANKFENWKATEVNQNRNFKNLRGEPKEDLEESIYDEQGGVCCYCGRRIVRLPKNYHVEHYLDQSKNTNLDLNYCNLFLSCQRDLQKGDPLVCGRKKDDWEITDKALKPSILGCENRFEYFVDGSVAGTDEHAQEVVIQLDLNNTILSTPRRELIAALEIDIKNHNIDVKNELTRLRQKDTNGLQSNFGHALARYLAREFGL